jgi:hypothetical protein
MDLCYNSLRCIATLWFISLTMSSLPRNVFHRKVRSSPRPGTQVHPASSLPHPEPFARHRQRRTSRQSLGRCCRHDNALARVIAQLRKALGDDAKVARYIETVPTIGYKFLADVVEHPATLAPLPAAPPLVLRKLPWLLAGALALPLMATLAAALFWERPRSPQPLGDWTACSR